LIGPPLLSSGAAQSLTRVAGFRTTHDAQQQNRELDDLYGLNRISEVNIAVVKYNEARKRKRHEVVTFRKRKQTV
jgi:hypothetical protein